MSTKKTCERPAYFIDPAAPSICAWKLGTTAPTVHSKKPMPQHKKTYENILETIGCTPLVKLNKIPQSAGIKCDMYAKCEFMNPAGSIKDRIADRMIEDAEQAGKISPGWTLIEPTAGNTGIGLAMAAAVKGYHCIIVMPEHMSMEKESVLRALNAEVVRALYDVPYDHPDSVISVAQRLAHEIPNAIVLDQLKSASNPLAHYDGTAPEILYQLDNKVDMIVGGAATGGTITGIARYIKENLPSCKVVGVDPYGSNIARPISLNKTNIRHHEVEGMGFQFATTVTDHECVDEWIKTNDLETFPMCRRLIKEEGLLVGGSSGAAMSAALRAAKDLDVGQRCVVILADGTRNYLTKFVSDNWMEAHNLKDLSNEHNYWWWNLPISDLKLTDAVVIKSDATFLEALAALKLHHLTSVPILNTEKSHLLGIILHETLMNHIVSRNAQLNDLAIKAITKHPICLKTTDILGKLARVLETEPCVLITKIDGDKEIVTNTAYKMDFMNFLAERKQQQENNGLSYF